MMSNFNFENLNYLSELKIDYILYIQPDSLHNDGKTSYWIGIAVGVFFAGLGIGYAVFPRNFDNMYMNPKQMQNMINDPNFRQQIMTRWRQNPQTMSDWMNQMMADPQLMSQMHDIMMNDPNHVQQMHQMM